MGEVVTMVPQDGIIVPCLECKPKAPGAEPTKFALFTQDWIDLQNFVTVALTLPISVGDFKTKYGTFDTGHQKAIEDCVGAFEKLHKSADKFGNPAVLMTELKTLMGAAKPQSIYGEIVWVANRIAAAAGTFKNGYDTLEKMFKRTMSKEERKENLIELLTGHGGLRDTALRMEKECGDLRTRLIAFSEEIGEDQKAINAYANTKGDVYAEAVKRVGELADELHKLELEIQKHNDAYIGYSVGAGLGAAMIFILTFGVGLPFAIAYGVGMGVGGAEMARQQMENAKRLQEKAKGDQKQKLTLVAHLDQLNLKIGGIQKKVNAVCDGLKGIIGVWNNQVSVLDEIARETKLELMVDYSAFNQQNHIMDAQEKWEQIARDTYQFTSCAFAEYREAA